MGAGKIAFTASAAAFLICRESLKVAAFAPLVVSPVRKSLPFLTPRKQPISSSSATNSLAMTEPSLIIDSGIVESLSSAVGPSMMESLSSSVWNVSPSTSGDFISSLIAFADQGQNLAGVLFQASLLPYLVFLYFLNFRGNRVPTLGNFGFQFLLLFVLSTIPGGILSKGVYGVPLADCDWLHGSAEALLTITNLLIVFGFKQAATREMQMSPNQPRLVALGCFAAFALSCFVGPTLGFQAHSRFLFGLGDLPADMMASLPWVIHTEPINALSIPTWAIHFSSVYEFIFAMSVIWNFSEATENPTWKGLTWGMLPLHASGLAACTYHFFYNPSSLKFLVATQAGLTLLGNITLAIAAFRIARSNGWNLDDLNPLPKSNTSPTGLITDNIADTPLKISSEGESDLVLAAKLGLLTFGSAYLVKYGELGLDIPFRANPVLAVAVVVTPPALLASLYWNKSKESGVEPAISIPGFGVSKGERSLSMEDIKKYGVAGTVAYVLTEIAFWAVAFPVASTALYQSTGHWPDVINDATDRATVLGFIFAGANIARLAVPLRLGVALAFAPWVDENIINREKKI